MTHTEDYTNDTRTKNRRRREVSINPEGSLGIKHRWQNQTKAKNKTLHDHPNMDTKDLYEIYKI